MEAHRAHSRAFARIVNGGNGYDLENAGLGD